MARQLFGVREGFRINDSVDILINAGSPEGSITANPASLCLDTTNGVLYVKETGTGNTGWAESSGADISAFSYKEPVRVATTANITLTGEQTIDGVSAVSGDRVLVKDQVDGSQNGIYIVGTGAWTRSEDANESVDVKAGMIIPVNEGTDSADTVFMLSTDDPITLGTTSLSFVKIGVYTPGNGINISGGTISVNVSEIIAANSGLQDSSGLAVVAGDGIDVGVGGVSVDVTDIIDTTAGLTEDVSNNIQVNLDAVGALEFNSGAIRINSDATNGSTIINSSNELEVNGYAKKTGSGDLTTQTVVDSFAVADFISAKWRITLIDGAATTNRFSCEVSAITDGTTVDWTQFAELYLGNNFKGGELDISISISGGNMQLLITTATLTNVTYSITRIAEVA